MLLKRLRAPLAVVMLAISAAGGARAVISAQSARSAATSTHPLRWTSQVHLTSLAAI